MTDFHFALVLILCAAVLHALWNAIIKGAADRMVTMGLINLGHGVLGVAMVLSFAPPVAASWPLIAASTGIHFFYYAFLLYAYKHGDLSQVYPIARGVAPVLVTLGALIFLGEALPPGGWVGVMVISLGIGVVFLARGGAEASGKAIIFAVLTGVTIASYSVVDGAGVRASEAPLGYIGWLFVFECMAGFGFLYLRRSRLRTLPAGVWVAGLIGGIVSAVAYGLAIYAQTLTSLGAVSAIRESSVVIAALIGVCWFGERPWKLRLVAAGVVAAGVILLAMAPQ